MTRLVALLDEHAQELELQALQLEEQGQLGGSDAANFMFEARAAELGARAIGFLTVAVSEALRQVAEEGGDE
jgi:hypothetical protein